VSRNKSCVNELGITLSIIGHNSHESGISVLNTHLSHSRDSMLESSPVPGSGSALVPAGLWLAPAMFPTEVTSTIAMHF